MCYVRQSYMFEKFLTQTCQFITLIVEQLYELIFVQNYTIQSIQKYVYVITQLFLRAIKIELTKYWNFYLY